MSRLLPRDSRAKQPSSQRVSSKKALKLSISPQRRCIEDSAGDGKDEDEVYFPEIHFQSSSDQHELIIDNISCMLIQERNIYSCEDWINGKVAKMKYSYPGKGKRSTKPVNEICREQICEWCYRVINFFKLDREIVYVAMSFLDRFLSKCTVDRHTYKIAATTSLLLVLKVRDPRKVILSNVITDLSRGEFDCKDIEKMEMILLRTLSWRINPPTPYSFVSLFLMLNPYASRPIQEFDVDGIEKYAVFFVEMAVFDYFLVTSKQSDIAFAAILNAMEGLGLWNTPRQHNKVTSRSSVSKYVFRLCTILGVSHNSNSIENVRERLWDLYLSSEEYGLSDKLCVRRSIETSSMANRENTKKMIPSNNDSPKSVSH